MSDPYTPYAFDDTHPVAIRVLVMIALFATTAILWRRDFFSGIYRLIVLFKAALTPHWSRCNILTQNDIESCYGPASVHQ